MDEQIPLRPIVELIEGTIRESMNPVPSCATINFLQWLASSHPEVQKLNQLPEKDVLELVVEFNDSKLIDVTTQKTNK